MAFWTNYVYHFSFVCNNPMLIITIRVTQLNSFLVTHFIHPTNSILKEMGLMTAITFIRRWNYFTGHNLALSELCGVGF